MTLFFESPSLPLFFLFGSLFLITCSTALLRLGKFKSKELLRSPRRRPHLFFRHILKYFFPKNEWENLYFCISLTKHICGLAYATSSFFYLLQSLPRLHHLLLTTPGMNDWLPLLTIAGAIIALSLALDFFLRLF